MFQQTGINESAVNIATYTMKSKKQLGRPTIRRNVKAFFLRSGKSLQHDLKTHRLRWAWIYAMHLYLLSMIVWLHSSPVGLIVAAAELVLVLVTFRLVAHSIFNPGRAVHNWAVEEQKHQHIKTLTGKTSDELEKMLQYHMEQGNMEEADRVSLNLLAMVEGDPTAAQSHICDQAKANDDGTIALNSALPTWMNKDNEPEPDSSNLPDWMRKS